ncbi:SpoIIE family protein phosphatase [Kineococcus sp. LSe6-4]|uniref:SpoIIE family protein phosphatase n=1 Tax=Kineococcus halophytocola TaxID=3234027 RepID=A0ABV4GYN9_9ACTN
MSGAVHEPELPVDEGVGSDRLRSAAMHQVPWYVFVMSGPQHRVVAANRAILNVLGGFNPVGLTVTEVLGGSESQGIVEMYDRAYDGEQAQFHRMRFAVAAPNGHREEIVIDFEVSPFRDAGGSTVGIIAVGRNVIDLVRREEAEAAAAAELTRRYRRATDVIEEVQRALLPARLPVLPRVQVAASYVVGGAEQAAGGDWFDVLARPDGTVAAVVGDVVGHGVAASAVMAQLRAVALERLDAGADPAQTVAALDRFTRVVPAARSATVCVLVLAPGRGEGQDRPAVTYCLAGHPPPLVLDPGGGSRYLDPSGTPPLGSRGDGGVERDVQRAALGAGELVLLYTDGIIERPGVPGTVGTVELARTAAAAAADELIPAFTLASAVDRVSAQTLERLTRETGSLDDVTLLALQPVTPSPDLHVHTRLTRAGIPAVRAQLRRWLGPDRTASLAVDQLDEVVGELLENVVDHAYGIEGPEGPGDLAGRVRVDGEGPVTVRAHLDDLGLLTVSVADEGTWVPRPEPVAHRGMGLTFAQEFAEQVHVDSSTAGTTVTVLFRPWTSSRGAAPVAPRQVPGLFDTYTEHREGRAVMTVRGPVDAANVAELDSELALNVVPGAAPLQVDLQQVSVLSSAALHTLRRRLEQGERAGVRVDLLSSPGTVAQQVLALAGMDTGRRAATGGGDAP